MENRTDPAETDYPRLLSLTVHELRTPASVVGGYLRMLQRDAQSGLSERQRKMVDEAQKSCARIVALIDELGELAKLDAGTATVKEETFDLFAAVEEVAADVHEVEDREVHLLVGGESAGAVIKGDRTRLGAAFTAFFRAILREQSSAATVLAERRRVADGGGNSAVIVIARNEDVQRAYDAQPARFDEQRGGLGLALPIARRVVQRHGGRVWSPAAVDGPGALSARSAILVSVPLSQPAEQSR